MKVDRFSTTAAPVYEPHFLVVVHDDTSIQGLPAAAAQARQLKGRLLVALAKPRARFTTDAAIARFAARRANDALSRREREVQRLLRGSGVHWTTVTMPFRDSRSATRRGRRLAAARKRLARRRGLTLLPAPCPQAPPSTDRRSHQPQPDASTVVGPLALAGPRTPTGDPR